MHDRSMELRALAAGMAGKDEKPLTARQGPRQPLSASRKGIARRPSVQIAGIFMNRAKGSNAHRMPQSLQTG